jgi:hypothetical protein
MKECIIENCNCEADKGRRYCHKHFLQRKAKQRKERKERGLKVRTTWTKQCEVCGDNFESFNRERGRFCPKCWNKIKHSGSNTNNNYSYIPKQEKNKCWEHRRIAEQVLNRKLNTNEVVHHLDENPKNNKLTNLIVISRKVHTSLHQFLKIQGVILEGSKNENNENCWDNLKVPMTTAWLETTDAKVLKLWEIGQSAAEPLS